MMVSSCEGSAWRNCLWCKIVILFSALCWLTNQCDIFSTVGECQSNKPVTVPVLPQIKSRPSGWQQSDAEFKSASSPPPPLLTPPSPARQPKDPLLQDTKTFFLAHFHPRCISTLVVSWSGGDIKNIQADYREGAQMETLTPSTFHPACAFLPPSLTNLSGTLLELFTMRPHTHHSV